MVWFGLVWVVGLMGDVVGCSSSCPLSVEGVIGPGLSSANKESHSTPHRTTPHASTDRGHEMRFQHANHLAEGLNGDVARRVLIGIALSLAKQRMQTSLTRCVAFQMVVADECDLLGFCL